jgi:hypothetical protein
MPDLATVFTSAVGANRDDQRNVLLLTCTVSELEDTQEIELMRGPGVDANPPLASTVLVLEIAPNWQIAIAVDDGVEPETNPGEKEIYSSALGAKIAKVKCDLLGNVAINDGTGSAVEFARMKAAFDQLKNEVNALVTAYNAHIHITTATVGVGPPGVIAKTLSTATPPTADMTAAESPTAKVP